MKNPNSNYSKIFGASAAGYVIWNAICGGLFVFLILVYFGGSSNWWIPLLIILGSWFLANIWLFNFKIIINSEFIEYHTLFSSARKLFWSEITNARIVARGFREYPPTAAREVLAVRSANGSVTEINLKVFGSASREVIEEFKIRNLIT